MNFSNSDFEPLNLNKGDILDLTKAAPSLKKVILGAGWDVNNYGSNEFDLDISAFCLHNGKVVDVPNDVVYFKNMAVTGVILEGDNRTGQGDGDDERIRVNLDEIPAGVTEIIFNVNIYDCQPRQQTFGMIDNSYIRLLDAENDEKELCRFELKKEASNATAIIFAKLFRTRDGWSFEALGEPLVVKDLNQVLYRYYNH